jgi:hypothetical protein
MATEVNTFSAAVDAVLVRSGRPERRADAISYVRQTLRECQTLKKTRFARDLIELSITSTGSPHIWDRPQELRIVRTAKYATVFDRRGNAIYPKFLRPGKMQEDEPYLYYGGPTYYAFKGADAGVQIDIAYYAYFKKLPYYAVADRVATFDLDTDTWSYLAATTDQEKEAARNLVSNWLLFDWYDLILEGALAKILKTVNDDRAVSTFALYKSLQNDLIAGEEIDAEGM